METLILFTAYIFAVHRITRFITTDYLTENIRVPIQDFFEARYEKRTGESSDDTYLSKIAYLLGCMWCMSIWVAALTIVIVCAIGDIDITVIESILWALTASTITGLLSNAE
nr:protein of unknown function (DUF1360) [uncultured bacterium]AMP54290.1 protein of unknown function (DUF1360) [uncultured bacterium]AMP54366.1 protein of unknown function (DUF1360) [uncultured bacterium]AMP54405.1 protein of unknown function (DUF1360) [uncultured bacterium]